MGNDDILYCSVTFCGAAVLKVMDKKTFVKHRQSYEVHVTVYLLTLAVFAKHKFTNLLLETICQTYYLFLCVFGGIRLSPKQARQLNQRLAYH